MPQREPHAQTDLICIIALPINIGHRPAQIGGSARVLPGLPRSLRVIDTADGVAQGRPSDRLSVTGLWKVTVGDWTRLLSLRHPVARRLRHA